MWKLFGYKMQRAKISTEVKLTILKRHAQETQGAHAQTVHQSPGIILAFIRLYNAMNANKLMFINVILSVFPFCVPVHNLDFLNS